MSLLCLPTESLDEVARKLAKPQLLALCLVSKRLNAISTRSLYRQLHLGSPPKAILCFKSLISNVLAAKAVRHFSVFHFAEYCSSAYYHILLSVLHRLSNITALSLQLGDTTPWDCLWGLKRCEFPNLRVLQLHAARVGPILALIRNVRSIHTLHLHFHNILDTRPSMLGPFPNLVEYAGSGAYLPDVVSGSSLRSATFNIDETIDISSVIESLSRSAANVNFVDILASGWNPRAFELLAVHVPGVTTLQYSNCSTPALGDVKAFLSTIQPLFCAFKDLQHLEIHYPKLLYNVESLFGEDVRDDHDFVQAVGKQCPKLTSCMTPAVAEWQKIHANVWIPVWQESSAREWVLDSEIEDIRSRPWFEPLVEHLCEVYHLENPLEDGGSESGSILSESDDSDDYEPVPRSRDVDETGSEDSHAGDSENHRDARRDAISFLEDLWYFTCRSSHK